MSQLWFFYNNRFQPVTFDINNPDITIGNNKNHTITIRTFTIDPEIKIQVDNKSGGLVLFQGNDQIANLNDGKPVKFTIDGTAIKAVYHTQISKEKVYYIGDQSEVSFHKQSDSFSYNTDESCSLMKDESGWMIHSKNAFVYVNGERSQDLTSIRTGDIVFYKDMFITLVQNDSIAVSGIKSPELALPKMKLPTTVLKEKYPAYRRTPRMVYELPDDNVSFTFPSEETEDNRRGLLLIIMPPLVMLVVMGIVALVRPRGIFIIISIAIFGTTLITSTVQYFKEKKNLKAKREKRKRLYTRYLEDKRIELQNLSDKQRWILYYHYPSFERMKYLTSEISERIWERTLMSSDFLNFRVGRASVPSSYEVSIQRSDMSNQEIDDLLEKSQELVSHYKQVKNVPLTINLSQGSMGLIGKESIVKNEIQQIIGQLSFSQSYHDVRFVAIFHEDDYQDWEWMKYLPHFQMPQSFAKGFIYNEQTRDQLLSSIHEMLKERELDEEKEKKLFSPHLVFIVTNRQLISEHIILEYLEGEHTDIGISTIFAADTKESLTENIHTLVRYIDEQHGDILIQEQKAVHIPFELDVYSQVGKERFSRMLRSLDHQLGMSNSIPDTVSFMELFKANKAAALRIRERWFSNETSKSLAVPIGLKGKDDRVFLNLHEKAHGPHGLLAGTTGSGKSEFLQTYILSMAVNFHPHEVAFLLIDYKGGGMAQPFKNMPHLLGTITNIEGSKNFSKRALESIKSELRRRQLLFDEYGVNHINDYTEMYKTKVAQEPLPHLFLISDEFAELKNEEPDFIRELVSAARIGRSLGVHLILATQKPGGIIDDQIWSNARFKVALKVQDDSDSKEILKNSDASKLTVTGRGYLQVGNNEVYELFQSAWSGAPYMKEAFGTEDAIALVTDLGLQPLSDVATKESTIYEKKTEIEAVVDEIVQQQEALMIKKLSSPWLPPLPNRLIFPQDANRNEKQFSIAMIDEPEQQRQSVYYYKAMEDGNIGIFGSSGYGKSTTLLTLLLQFSEMNSPEVFQFYIFDFGNGTLLPLQQLPHTGDYFRSDDQRKIEKFMNYITEEMESRKQLFRNQQVSNIQLYNTISEHKLPLIYITLDNFDLVKEELQEMESRFVQIARDGQSLGIYTVLTATRANAVRQALMSNLKTKIVHYLMDTSEKLNILGRTPYETEATPGRAYVKKEEAFLAQIYMPTDGQTDIEVLEQIKDKVTLIAESYAQDEKPEPIPMLPSTLDFVSFHDNYGIRKQKGLLPIGLDEDSVRPVYMNINKNKHTLVIGDAQKGKTNVLKLMMEIMLEISEVNIGLFDSISHHLNTYAEEEKIDYLETKETIVTWLESVEKELSEREASYLEAVAKRTANHLDFHPIVLMIDGVGHFQQQIDTTIQTKLTQLMKNYSHLGFHMIVTGTSSEFTKGFDPLTNELKQVKQAVLLMKKMEQSLFNLPFTRNEQEIQAGYGYYIENGDATKIQIPHCELERVMSS
ncbi:type VII secretion protein EssC [Virgibacillus sp. W0181]|uniref:type VII secretion protein EssC n=1 Tax=Virgibacillus sp. W0181 TaxID=3391581 RepID=UPI003F476194